MSKRGLYANRRWVELVALRAGAGLSQDELAKQVGADRADISRMERGMWLPTADTQQKIAEALGVSYEDLERGAMRLRTRHVPDVDKAA